MAFTRNVRKVAQSLTGAKGVAKVWVSFDGEATNAAANDSFNLTSMTDNGTGDYTVTINNDFSAATYACATGVGSASASGRYLGTINDGAKAVGSCGFFCLHSSTGSALDSILLFMEI